jgi:NADPH:quinone reductase-like Zn-dependent oxidoreductase
LVRASFSSLLDVTMTRAPEIRANEGINYKTVPEWGARARELTGGIGVDHVVEVGGAGTLTQSLRAIRYGGRISVIGVLAGAAQELNIAPIFQRNAHLQGIWIGSREMFEAMNRAIALHALHPVIDSVFPFEEARAAFERMARGAHFGKIVVRV